MVHRDPEHNPFEFVIVSALRAAQLMRGCSARVDAADRPAVTAQREVAAGLVRAAPRQDDETVPPSPTASVASDMFALARESDGFAGSGQQRRTPAPMVRGIR